MADGDARGRAAAREAERQELGDGNRRGVDVDDGQLVERRQKDEDVLGTRRDVGSRHLARGGIGAVAQQTDSSRGRLCRRVDRLHGGLLGRAALGHDDLDDLWDGVRGAGVLDDTRRHIGQGDGRADERAARGVDRLQLRRASSDGHEGLARLRRRGGCTGDSCRYEGHQPGQQRACQECGEQLEEAARTPEGRTPAKATNGWRPASPCTHRRAPF